MYLKRITAYAGAPFLRLIHTFIITRDTKTTKYSDIGLDWDTRAREIALHTPGTWQEAGMNEPAFILQFGHRSYEVNVQGRSRDLAGRLVGAAMARTAGGAVFLLARDFWQNYPAELEAAKGNLVYHFWPRHGKTPAHRAENLNSPPDWFEEKYRKALGVSSQWLVSIREQLDDYGMFNYGDIHQSWKGNGWNAHRHWPGMHHGGPRWAWMQYFRDPTSANFKFAEAYTRHCYDIDVCHYATKEYNRRHWSRYEKKAIGGLCKYNAPVHWTQGNAEGSAYNYQTDFLLWQYYLTGDRRALDVAMEMGTQLGKFLAGQSGRGAEGPGCASLTLYQHTWDNSYLEVFENQFRSLVSLEQKGVGGGFSNYHPFLDRYWEHTGCQKAREMLLKRAATCLSGASWPWGERTTYYNWLAYGYLFTRNPEFLAAAMAQLDWFSKSYLETDDPLHRACLTISNFPGVPGYTGQQVHTLLFALQQHGGPVPMSQLNQTYLYSELEQYDHRHALRVTRFYVRRNDGREVAFEWRLKYRYKEAFARILSPEGKIIWRQELVPNRKGFRWTHFSKRIVLDKTMPAGDYLFEVGSRDRVWTYIPIRGEKIDKLSFVILRPSGPAKRQRPGGIRMHACLGYFYFRVPPSGKLNMTFWPQVQEGLHGLRLYDSRGKEVGTYWWKKGRSHEWNLTVSAEERGKIWRLEKMYCPNFAVQFSGPDAPRYAAFLPERLYEPKPVKVPGPLYAAE